MFPSAVHRRVVAGSVRRLIQRRERGARPGVLRKVTELFKKFSFGEGITSQTRRRVGGIEIQLWNWETPRLFEAGNCPVEERKRVLIAARLIEPASVDIRDHGRR